MHDFSYRKKKKSSVNWDQELEKYFYKKFENVKNIKNGKFHILILVMLQGALLLPVNQLIALDISHQ